MGGRVVLLEHGLSGSEEITPSEYREPIPIINKPASRAHAATKKASKMDQDTGATFSAPREYLDAISSIERMRRL